MTVVKPDKLLALSKLWDPQIAAVLVYGSDDGAVSELASALVRGLIGNVDDPFSLVRLDEQLLAADPARLMDEVQSMSMLGGQKVVWVKNPGPVLTRTAELVLRLKSVGNLLVIEAGTLQKDSRLRSLFESAENAFCVPCYSDNLSSLSELAVRSLSDAGISISEEALEALTSHLGNDRLISRSELEKLKLYVLGRNFVEIADVFAVCGDGRVLSADIVIDAVFAGEMDVADVEIEKFIASGQSMSMLLSIGSRHAQLLQRLRSEVDLGKPVGTLVKSHRPAIFFNRISNVTRQLRIWSESDLEKASSTLHVAQSQCRQSPQMENTVAGRAFLSVCRLARALGREIN